MIRVTYFQRRANDGFWSLERIYSDVRENLSTDIKVSVHSSRFRSQGFFRRLYNLLSATFYQGDINHVTGDVHFLTYLLRKKITILTILDCVMLSRLKGVKWWIFWFFWYWLPEKRSAVIVTISEFTRQEVLRILKCRPEKLKVVYCSVSSVFQRCDKSFNNGRPRILHIGITENKNLERHLSALEGIACNLVIIGNLSNEQQHILNRSGISYQNYVGLSLNEIVEQYQLCDLLLFASTYEGFGLPIIEAQSIGRPVITSNICSMPEVAGGAACLVDPFDVKSIRLGINRVISDDAFRADLVANGYENAKRFSIENIALQYSKLYRGLQATRN